MTCIVLDFLIEIPIETLIEFPIENLIEILIEIPVEILAEIIDTNLDSGCHFLCILLTNNLQRSIISFKVLVS